VKKFILLATFFSSFLYSDGLTPFTLQKQEIHGYFSLPKNKESYPIVIAVQNSIRESILPFLHHFKEIADELEVALIGIEKEGIIGPDQIDERIYDLANFREKRIDDHIALIDEIRMGLFEGWNGEIIFLGGSEGGFIAIQLAAITPETEAAMIFSAGGGLSAREEAILGAEKYLKSMGTPSFVIPTLVTSFKSQLDKMVANPTPFEYFYDYTYLWWASHLSAPSTLEAALNIQCPILYVHGTEDEIIPIESADTFVDTFQQMGKTNLTYLRLEGFTHDLLRHDLQAVQDTTDLWLKSLLIANH
jgi:pimeloyl-ACP methyl ester carboxylesterase